MNDDVVPRGNDTAAPDAPGSTLDGVKDTSASCAPDADGGVGASAETQELIRELARAVDGTGERRGETRLRIIQTAVPEFRAQGYAGTSIRRIADGVGVTPPALYSHFSSKSELLGVAVVYAHLLFLRTVVVPTDPADPPPGRLEGMIRRAMGYEFTSSGRKSWFDLLIDNQDEDGLLSPEHHRLSDRARAAYLGELESAVVRAGGSGTGRLEAEIIFRICENTIALQRGLGVSAEATIDATVRVLLRLPAGV